MPDGTVIKGAQGNRPIEQVTFFGLADNAAKAESKNRFLAEVRQAERSAFAVPWLRPAPDTRLDRFSAAEIEAVHFSIPQGVFARQGTSPFSPAKLPDLIGIKDRRYLDATGLVRQRGIGDLMRYAALNQGMDMLAHYGDFIPAGTGDLGRSPSVLVQIAQLVTATNSFTRSPSVYSLKPPPNQRPHGLPSGRAGLRREGCTTSHAAAYQQQVDSGVGFAVPADHPARLGILTVSVGTDPRLAMTTRRGTGYYKVPSLKGVWYRGPFEHNGSVETLEDWFDPRRVRDDYVTTGWKGYGVKTRAVKGHEFGLKLSDDDRRALIAFLKTL